MSPRSSRTTSDVSSFIRILKRLPFSEDDKTAWIETIQKDGFNEFLAKDIHAKLAEITNVEEEHVLQVKQDIAAVNKFMQKWRLSQNLSQFHKR